MPVMGLDLSLTSTGIAVMGEGKELVYGETVGYSMKRTAKVRDKIERMLKIANQVICVAREHKVTKVAIEGFAYAARGAQNDLGELHGIVKSQLWLGLRLEPMIIAPTRARKIVLGKGNASKAEVLDGLTKHGYDVTDHNIGDAIVVALAADGEET